MKSKKVNWSKQTCHDLSLKCKTRGEFNINHSAAYQYARKRGWLDDICSHMIKTYKTRQKQDTKFTKVECRKESKKYTNRTDFKKNSSDIFNFIKSKGWMNELCQHMIKPTISFTKEECIKEAKKFKTRKSFSSKKGSMHRYASKMGWLSEMYSHMFNFRKENNYWTKERCHEEALKYEYRADFIKNAAGAQNAAKNNGWVREICSHMKTPEKPLKEKILLSYTKEQCTKEALKYKKRMDFSYFSSSIFIYSKSQGWLDEICDHMLYKKLPQSYWTKDKCVEAASKCKNRREFNAKHISAYLSAFRNNWLDEVFPKEISKESTSFWTNKKKCEKEALKYQSKSSFIRNSNACYRKALKKGWIDEICSHMIPYNDRPIDFWTKEKCSEAALDFYSVNGFRKEAQEAYSRIAINGWLGEMCAHMKKSKQKKSKSWTKNSCKREALKYKSKVHFKYNNRGAFEAAYKNGWLDEFYKKEVC